MIEVDVSELHIGDAIRVSDLPTSTAYDYLSRQEQILVHVIAPKVEVEETDEEGLEAGEGDSETAPGDSGEDSKEEGSDGS